MCGILGHYRADAGRPAPPELAGLVGTLSHRGPDDGTYWQDERFAFGHRRLSIIDLAGGGQPMATDEGDVVVTFNGEIYNYLELRAELESRGCRFRTQSDTEVLLHGYREWNRELLGKLEGMFAFGLADRRRQELLLARDRFGEKPLLYLDDQDSVTFASELRPLSLMTAGPRAVDETALGRYLCLNYVPGDSTLFQGVRRLPPASWRVYERSGRVTAGRYWTPPASGDVLSVSMAQAVPQLEALLDDSVRFALRSDVPVGLFLSSGIDSSLVGRSAARSGRLERAFCLGFDESTHSEVPGATVTARHLGVALTDVTLTPAALGDFLSIVSHADDPLADSSCVAVWTLARQAARHVKVVLSGDGGDELFGGYLTHRASMWHAAVTSRLPKPVQRAMAALALAVPIGESKVSTSYKLMRYLRAAALPVGQAHFSWNGTWLPAQAAGFVESAEARESAAGALEWMAARHGLIGRPGLRPLQDADVADYLANDILVKGDRMSMAHGLEVRSPFLNPRLAEFALRLPGELKAGLFGAGKRILRELAARTYGIDVARSKKQGFSIPVHAWLRGPARPLAEDLLSPASVARVAPLNARAVTAAWNDHVTGRRSYGFELWGLMVLVAWHREHMQSRPAWTPGSAARAVTFDSRPAGAWAP